jgi:hypothetical protein
MSYGIIIWRNSTDSKRIFIIQKKIISIMAGVKRRVSCREVFKKFKSIIRDYGLRRKKKNYLGI